MKSNKEIKNNFQKIHLNKEIKDKFFKIFKINKYLNYRLSLGTNFYLNIIWFQDDNLSNLDVIYFKFTFDDKFNYRREFWYQLSSINNYGFSFEKPINQPKNDSIIWFFLNNYISDKKIMSKINDKIDINNIKSNSLQSEINFIENLYKNYDIKKYIAFHAKRPKGKNENSKYINSRIQMLSNKFHINKEKIEYLYNERRIVIRTKNDERYRKSDLMNILESNEFYEKIDSFLSTKHSK